MQSEEELEQFLGDLVKRAGSAIGSFVRSDTGKALTSMAKDVAKQALPSVGQAVGGYFGGAPGAEQARRSHRWRATSSAWSSRD